MKKFIITATLMITLLFSSITYAAKPITIELNGKEVKSEVAPFIQNERTLVPIRFISEALGCNVKWDANKNEITIESNDITIQMTTGKKDFLVGNQKKVMDVAPFVKQDRAFVPLRFVGENMKVDVKWDDANRKVILTKEDKLANFTNEEKAYYQEYTSHENAISKSMGELKSFFFENASKYTKEDLAANYDRLKAQMDTHFNSIKNMTVPAKFETAHKLAVDANRYLDDMLPQLRTAILETNEDAAKQLVNLLTQYQIKMAEVKQAMEAAREGRQYVPQKDIQVYNDEKKKQDDTNNLLQDKNIQHLLKRI